jgi:hypothetical protein
MADIWIQDTWFDCNGLSCEADIIRPTLQIFPFKLLVPYRFESIAELKGTGSRIVEKRSEDEVSTWGYYNRMVLLCVEPPRQNITCASRILVSIELRLVS